MTRTNSSSSRRLTYSDDEDAHYDQVRVDEDEEWRPQKRTSSSIPKRRSTFNGVASGGSCLFNIILNLIAMASSIRPRTIKTLDHLSTAIHKFILHRSMNKRPGYTTAIGAVAISSYKQLCKDCGQQNGCLQPCGQGECELSLSPANDLSNIVQCPDCNMTKGGILYGTLDMDTSKQFAREIKEVIRDGVEEAMEKRCECDGLVKPWLILLDFTEHCGYTDKKAQKIPTEIDNLEFIGGLMEDVEKKSAKGHYLGRSSCPHEDVVFVDGRAQKNMKTMKLSHIKPPSRHGRHLLTTLVYRMK